MKTREFFQLFYTIGNIALLNQIRNRKMKTLDLANFGLLDYEDFKSYFRKTYFEIYLKCLH